MPGSTGVSEIFWQAAPASASLERTPEAVVRQALLAIGAFEEGQVPNRRTGRPITLMELLADLGIEENLVYASPELARGESFDERSLVFTVGVLIFERLTERHPFGSADNAQKVARIRRGEMGSGVNFFPSVPKELRSILMRCMGPFPEERYHTLQQLKEALARFIGQPHLAKAHPKQQVIEQPGGRNKDPGAKFFDSPTVVSNIDPLKSVPSAEDLDWEPETEEEPREAVPTPALAAVKTLEVPPPVSPPPLPGSALGTPPPRRLAERVLGSSTPDAAAERPAGEATTDPLLAEDTDEDKLASVDIPSAPPPQYRPAEQGLPVGLPFPETRAPRSEGSTLGPWAPVIYGLLGAGIASLVFLIISFGRGGSRSHRAATHRPSVEQADRKPVAKPQPPPVKVEPKSVEGGSRATKAEPKVVAKVEPKPEPKVVAKVEPKPEPKPSPKPETKTAAKADDSGEPAEVRSGRLVAEKVRPCGVGESGARSIRIGAFVKADGTVARPVANQKQGINSKQLNCLRHEMLGMQLPIRWNGTNYIEWSLRIFPDRVEASVAGPPDLKARLRRR
jgi:hypothetical protein